MINKIEINAADRSFTIPGHRTVYADNVFNYRLLAERGLVQSGPMVRQYPFKSVYDAPMSHQVVTSDFMTRHKRGFVLNSIGTGKTLSAYWAFDYLRSQGLAHKALVISPISVMRDTHAEELKWSFPHLRYAIVYGSKERRLKELKRNVDVYIINYDGFLARWGADKKTHKLGLQNRGIVDAFLARPDIDFILVDEIADMRNTRVHKWRTINYLYGPNRPECSVWGLTGSPMPKAPTDVYAQARLINPETLPHHYDLRVKKMVPVSFTDFQSRVMRQKGDWGWECLPGWEETCYRVLQPSVRFTREQVEPDLPKSVVVTREIEMSAAQKRAYNQMRTKFLAELTNGTVITAVHEGARLTKLNQIACGAVYDSGHSGHYLDCRARLDEVLRIKQQIGESHLLIAVPYKNIIEPLQCELKKYYSVDSIVGQSTSEKQRAEIMARFKYEDLQILIATPGSIPHGVNLQHQCYTTIWWGPIDRYDHYEQFNGRTDRKGQRSKIMVVQFSSAPVHRHMFSKLKKKENAQNILLQILQERV